MTVNQFIKAVEREQGGLRRFLRVLCRGDCAKADDIAQEALLKAYLHFADFSGRSKFSTWLYRIAYHSFLDWTRSAVSKENRQMPFDSRDVRNLTDAAPPPEDYRLLYEAIGDLSEDERTCILLYYMEECAIAEIAGITGMPSGTVKSHLSRARTHLKTKLKILKE